jgi:hypothetical protein
MKRDALEMMRLECSVRWPLTERKDGCVKQQARSLRGENRNKILCRKKRRVRYNVFLHNV